MNIKLSSILEYVTFILKKYNEIQRIQMENTFRVVNMDHAKDGNVICQVIGKSTFVEYPLEEILSDDAFLEQFSKKDIRMITYAYAQHENVKKQHVINSPLKLVQQEFNIHDRKIQYSLTDKEGNTITKTAAELFLDKKSISYLTQEDVMNISYVAGYEHGQSNSDK